MQHYDNKHLVDSLHNKPSLLVNRYHSRIFQGTIQYLSSNNLQDMDCTQSDYPMNMSQVNMLPDLKKGLHKHNLLGISDNCFVLKMVDNIQVDKKSIHLLPQLLMSLDRTEKK